MTTKTTRYGLTAGLLLACACLLLTPGKALRGAEAAGKNEPVPPAAPWNPQAAAHYLDEREVWWQNWDHAKRDHGTICVSCHTQAPYALARPMLREAMREEGPSAVEKAMLANVEKRVRGWKEMQPFYNDETSGKGKEIESRNAEAVLNAIILLGYDTRHLSEASRMALENAWALQSKSGPDAGAWVWQNFEYTPWESKESQYHWAATMAGAVGRAPDNYANSPALVGNISGLRMYLRTHYDTQPLLNKVALLWASARIQGLLTAAQRQSLAQAIYAAQSTDGGWSLSRLGNWERRDKTPLETRSDGYATGIVVLALEENRMTTSYLTRGVAWLESNQNPETGAWPAWSPNKNRDAEAGVGKFMSDAATGYAVLALKSANR